MYAIRYSTNGTTSYRAVNSSDDLSADETLSDMPPDATTADATALLSSAVQAWLDAAAIQNGYDSIASCISYRGSSLAQWDADAKAALAWRDAVWIACFQWQQAASSNPPATFPTSAQVIAQLPQPASYGWVAHHPGT